MISVAILGTRGIPASYSGFETSVQETSVRLVKLGYAVTVYCRSNHYSDKLSMFKGVHLKYSLSVKSKHLDTITSTIYSVFSLLKMNYDVIIVYGVGNSYFIPIINLFCRNVISVVDGADWEREKWGNFAKGVLRLGRYFAVKFAKKIVVDNELMVKRYSQKYKINPVYIAYGANVSAEYSKEILDKHDLDSGNYIIFVGRFVREKGIEFLIDNFESMDTNVKLVIVGGNDIDTLYNQEILSRGNGNIIFPGFVYGEEYESLLKYARFYVSCSLLEGTSPSLLSAMAINGFALVSDLEENVEVLKGSCATFKTGDSNDFRIKLKDALDSSTSDADRNATFKIVNSYYNWDSITNKYSDIIREIYNYA